MEVPGVIAKSSDWLALFKPAGWLSIPGRNTSAAVVSEWAEKEHGPIWIVHRLDRETSGVLLLARTAAAHREANGWFQRHEVRKAYDLLALGIPRAPTVRINTPVEGSRSVTQLECVERYSSGDECFLGRAVPLTGRRHQIRLHLLSEGHPLLGDTEYKGPREVLLTPDRSLQISRVALHAARLELPTREVFEAPWPNDFSSWVSELRGSR